MGSGTITDDVTFAQPVYENEFYFFPPRSIRTRIFTKEKTTIKNIQEEILDKKNVRETPVKR